MKQTIIILSLLLIVINLQSQDIIITKSGEKIQGLIIKVTENEIEYNKPDEPYGPTNVIAIEKVSAINYRTGSIDVFDTLNVAFDRKNTITLLEKLIEQDSLICVLLKEKIDKQQDISSETLSAITKTIENQTKHTEILKEQLSEQQEELNSIKDLTKTLEDYTLKKEKRWKPPPVGIGMNIFGFTNFFNSLTDLFLNEFVPTGQSIFIPFSFGYNFRIEVDFLYASLKKSYTETDSTESNYRISRYNYGVAILPMFQKGKTNIYQGIHFATHAQKNIIYKLTNDKITEKDTYHLKGYSISPLIGSEYAITNNFSIGGEVSLVCYIEGKQTVTEENIITGTTTVNPIGDDDTFSAKTTRTRIILRYYF